MKIPTSHSLALCSMVAGLLIAPLGMLADDKHPRPPIDFNQDVRPILSANCFFCHGPDRNHREGGLRLDDRNSAFGAGDSGETAIVPGKPQESEVMRRIHSADPEEQMPHPDAGKTLSPEQIDLLGRWIEEGAVWQEHWAYQQPIRTAVPTVRDPDWCRNWIDHFVLSALESQGRQPSSDAERITLMRRLYFDLTGLPPTPEEVADFLAEKQPQAYEQLVERLLASPHYGERMAMYWLDLVRYADTVGYHGDQDHNISPYRDYVINAFNENMPLDQFTHEQLAGDLIAAGNSAQLTEERAIELKIASGYNRLLQTSHEGGVQKKEYLAIYAADRIRNLSGVWMGATMGCCQCHDHKFDPYTTRDFYAMAAFFADVEDEKTFGGSNTLPTKREPEMMVFSPGDYEQRADLAAQIEQLRAQGEPGEPGEPLEKLERQLAALEKRARRTMITVAVEPRITRVLPRGNWLDETGEVLQPAIPEFLGTLATNGKRADRWDLARWLTDTKTGTGLLTARVFANRCWYLLFGRGLAGPLDDFGGQGTPPSHPALLDALAIRLVESGWDMKQMMKLLVLSRAYQQSSLPRGSLPSEDPENRLFARQSRYRLPAELIRDNALFISGLLEKDLGGDSSRPYQPAGYYRHLNFPQRTYTADADQRQWRRGLYVHWQRQFLHPMLRAFDAPSREECTAERPRSNTPLAALVLLNDPTFLEAARALAERMIREGGPTPRSRIAFAFQLAVSRAPDAEEEELLNNLLRESRELYRQDPQAAEDFIQIGHRTAAEELEPVELAAWTTVARAVLNLHETITRN